MQSACQCGSCLALHELTDEEFVVLADMVGAEVGEEILKQSQREEAVAKRLARELDDTYLDDLLPAIDAEVSQIEGEFDPDRISELTTSIGGRLANPKDLGMGETAAAAAGAVMLLSRRGTRTKLRAAGRSIRSVPASLTPADAATAGKLGRVQTFWIGDYWSRHLSARIDATVRREALQRGLGRQEVGRILRGLVSGEFPGASVPGTFAGSTSQYFTVVAGTVRPHASSFGAIHAMADAEVERYEFFAVMDERTSEICRYMHGKTFTVRSARSLEDRMLRTEDPDEFKRVAGWRSLSDVQRIGGGGEDALAAAGIQLPPLHGLCRSIVLPV